MKQQAIASAADVLRQLEDKLKEMEAAQGPFALEQKWKEGAYLVRTNV